VEPQEYDEILRHLVRIAAHQDTINADLRAMLSRHDTLLQRQDTINERLTTIQERQELTLARIETLLARMMRGDTNGRDA
jgi:uncharacterized coiled-coil DUF342 family protein